MKTTKCVLCGRDFSISDETVIDQHVLCPYCGGKFSYLTDSPEFSVERLAYAIAECRKNEQDGLYYDAAPAGARLYIGLLFYGKVFKDRMNRDLYLAEMAEVESEMKVADWAYLLENEDDPELAAYFQSKLPEEAVVPREEKPQSEPYATPLQGVLRSPVPAKEEEVQEQPPAPVRTPEHHPISDRKVVRSKSLSTYLVLAAGIIGILLVCFIVIHSQSSGRTTPPPPEQPVVADDGRKEKHELQDEVSKRIAELETRRMAVDRSIDEVRANKNQFMNELNRTIEKGNVRSAELQTTKGVLRLNGAETAMSVLRAPFFNAFAIRYCGDKPFGKAETCREKVQQAIDACSELTPTAIESINQLAIACQDNAVGEVRRAINDKYNSLVALNKTISKAIKVLTLEQTEIVHLDAKKIDGKRNDIRNLFKTEAFTAECGLVAIDEYLNKTVTTEDVFVLANRVPKAESAKTEIVKKEKTGETSSSEKENVSSNVKSSEEETRKTESAQAKKKVERVADDTEDGDFSQKDASVVEKTTKERPRTDTVQKKKPRGRRQKCKSPIKCMNFAEPGHNFCSEHECHSYGCKEHVRTLTSPNWVHGGLGSMLSMSTADKNRIKRKRIGKFCPKHCCNRLCPEIKNYTESWNEYLFWDNDKTEKFFFCENERLAKSRYCSEHACPLPTCSSCREESWKLDDGTDRSNAAIVVDAGNYWWHHLRNWMLIVGPMCRAHGNMDPESVPERDKRTPGDLLREKEEARTVGRSAP